MEENKLHTIVKRCIEGNKKSRKVLYELLAPMMLAVAQRYANNTSDAEDIFQESVLYVFDRIYQLREPLKVAGWAKKIVIHEAIRFYKKKRNLYFSEETLDFSGPQNDNEIYRQIETDELLRIIQLLPDKMRMVINLYAIEGFQHDEIAEMLGISVGTSKSNLHDARKRIKKFISDETRKTG